MILGNSFCAAEIACEQTLLSEGGVKEESLHGSRITVKRLHLIIRN